MDHRWSIVLCMFYKDINYYEAMILYITFFIPVIALGLPIVALKYMADVILWCISSSRLSASLPTVNCSLVVFIDDIWRVSLCSAIKIISCIFSVVSRKTQRPTTLS